MCDLPTTLFDESMVYSKERFGVYFDMKQR